jgi:sortase (surface protein transpeptidase)
MMAEEEKLVMYTCYPFYVISSRKTDRLVVTAERVKGIDIKWRNME